MAKRILLVEDNEDFSRTLKIQLEDNGYQADLAADGEQGLELALNEEYSLVLLDISLPEMDGLEVLSEIRKQKPQLPVMMLTSKAEELDKVVGLNLGADDYVTKPFTVAELFARINALLRRASGQSAPDAVPPEHEDIMTCGELAIDSGSRTVTLRGEKVHLTLKEFELLHFLASHPGQAYSREELIDEVWEYDGGDYSQSVSNIIMQLRKKIEKDPADPVYILTVRGYGYRFARENEI